MPPHTTRSSKPQSEKERFGRKSQIRQMLDHYPGLFWGGRTPPKQCKNRVCRVGGLKSSLPNSVPLTPFLPRFSAQIRESPEIETVCQQPPRKRPKNAQKQPGTLKDGCRIFSIFFGYEIAPNANVTRVARVDLALKRSAAARPLI